MASDLWEYVDLLFLQRMRTSVDRDHIKNLYSRIFGAPQKQLEPTDQQIISLYNNQLPDDTPPYYHITPEILQVGYAALPRSHAQVRTQDSDTNTGVAANLELLPRMLTPLSHMMKCVEMGWMCVLCGPAASGMSFIVFFVP